MTFQANQYLRKRIADEAEKIARTIRGQGCTDVTRYDMIMQGVSMLALALDTSVKKVVEANDPRQDRAERERLLREQVYDATCTPSRRCTTTGRFIEEDDGEDWLEENEPEKQGIPVDWPTTPRRVQVR